MIRSRYFKGKVQEQIEEALLKGRIRCREKISKKKSILENLYTRTYASVQEHERKSHHYSYERITSNEKAYSLALQ